MCSLLLNNSHYMGLDPVQTLMVELISIIRVLALENRLFPAMVLMIEVSFLLKIVDGKAGQLLFANVMVLLSISLVSKTEDQGPQSWKTIYQLKIILLIVHLLPSSMMNHSTGQTFPLITRMPNFLSSNLIVKTTFTRALNMVSGLVHQMETESWMLHIAKQRRKKMPVLYFSFFR